MRKIIKTLFIIIVLIINCFLAYMLYKEVTKPYLREFEDELRNISIKTRTNLESMIGKDWVHSRFDVIVKECAEEQFILEKKELEDKVIDLSVLDPYQNEIGTAWDNKLMDYVIIKGYDINDFKMDNIDEESNNNTLSITIKKDIDKEKLSENITNMLDNLVVDMIGASGKLVNGIMEVTSEGQEGRIYNQEDKEKMIGDICASIKDDIFNDINESLEFVSVAVNPTSDDLKSIDTKLSSFSTSFAPGGSRGTNVSLAASRLNGVLLGPGEILSVDKRILSRNKANGYQPAGSYANGRTVQTYGGGVCQVSTTLYGAILRAGIVPIERNAHSMAVSYVPLGLDAAIAEGFKDLKIENTYDKPIYIEGYTRGGTLTFNIYGQADLLDGYTYRPVSSASGLHATAKLQKMKDGNVVESIQLPSSSYRPHG